MKPHLWALVALLSLLLVACYEAPKATEDDKKNIDRLVKEGISASPPPEEPDKTESK